MYHSFLERQRHKQYDPTYPKEWILVYPNYAHISLICKWVFAFFFYPIYHVSNQLMTAINWFRLFNQTMNEKNKATKIKYIYNHSKEEENGTNID